MSWKIYDSDLPFGAIFGYVRDRLATNTAPIAQFTADAAAGTLPQVAFVETENDEHPPSNVQLGQTLAARVIDAVMTSPLWRRAALFLTYDEALAP